MEPFEGGPGKVAKEKQEEQRASRAKVMEATAWATALFIIAILIVGGGGLLLLDVGAMSLLTWAVLVSPLLLINGVLLRKMRQNQHAKLAERMTRLSVVLVTVGAIGLSILSTVVSFVYCTTEFSKTLIHH